QGDVIGHALEIALELFFLVDQRFKKQRLAGEIQGHSGGVPMISVHLLLLDAEGPSFIEFAQNTPSEFHVVEQVSVDLAQSLLRKVQPEFARHSGVNRFLARCRLIVRIWTKTQLNHIAIASNFLVKEGVWQR